MKCITQISKYVEREIINHKQLRHPHIVELKEVCSGYSAPLPGMPVSAC